MFFFWLFSDFRSTISGVPYSSKGYCGNPGFYEATSVGWSSTININYGVNQNCYWFIHNPHTTGHMQLSFSNFIVSYNRPIYFKMFLLWYTCLNFCAKTMNLSHQIWYRLKKFRKSKFLDPQFQLSRFLVPYSLRPRISNLAVTQINFI